MNVTQIEFEAGYLVITDDYGRKTRYPIAPVLRAVDIPSVPASRVTGVYGLSEYSRCVYA